MIGLLDIKSSIVSLLKNNFKYKVINNAVKEGFDKPSFFIKVENLSINRVTPNLIEESIFVTINFFIDKDLEKHNTHLSVADALKRVFISKLKVKDRYLTIEEMSCDYREEVLEFTFFLSFYNRVEKSDNSEYAENISIRRK